MPRDSTYWGILAFFDGSQCKFQMSSVLPTSSFKGKKTKQQKTSKLPVKFLRLLISI